jgi:hypothetical protein
VRGAIGSRAVKHEFVPTYAKLTAGEAIDFLDTPAEFEHPRTSVTEKMVMVCLARGLIDRDRSWKLKGRKPALFEQVLNVLVNRRDAQPLFALLRRF